MIRKEESNLVLTLGSSFVYAILLAALFFFEEVGRSCRISMVCPPGIPLVHISITFSEFGSPQCFEKS
jgi:hypothetical protein